MPKEIFWSPSSEKDFAQILEYLYQNWDNKVVLRFIDRMDDLLIQISYYPKHYPFFSRTRNIRKCVISSHNTLFYREHNNSVELLRIFDTRQDPTKLKFV